MGQFEPLRVGIVGCGSISQGYGNSLQTRPDGVRIMGAFDLDAERAEAFAHTYGARAYESFEALLSDDEVEAVVNLTAHSAHAAVSGAALDAGKHVHSEKPLAGTREDGQWLLRLAQEKGVRLSCSPFTFLGEAQQTAWKAIRDGAIGKVLMAYADMNWGRIEHWHPEPSGFYQKDSSALLDLGVYALTLLTTILGPVRCVLGDAAILLPTRTVCRGARAGTTFQVTGPDQVTGLLDFEGGARARVTASFLGYSRQDGAEFHGETASLHLTSAHDFNGAVELRKPDENWQPVPHVAEPFPGVEWGRAIFELAESLRVGVPQHCTGEQAHHVLDVCLSILESAEQRVPVDVTSRFAPPPPSY